MINNVDLRDYTTFQGIELTPLQLKDRHEILSKEAIELDNKDQELSPRSQRELNQLASLIMKQKTASLEGIFPITRMKNLNSDTPYYYVKFPSVKTWVLDTYNKLSSQIEEVPDTGFGIISAVQPNQKTWFYQAMDLQKNVVFKSDFMKTLYYAYVANISLLRATALLVKHPESFKSLLMTYSDSYNLYQDQVNFNRSVERETLNYANFSYLQAQQLIRDCGKQIQSELQDHQTLLTFCKEVYEAEEKQSIAYNTQLETFCEQFVKKVTTLEEKLKECFDKISNKQQAVQDAIGQIKNLVNEEKVLNNKKVEIQAKFNEYQRRIELERASERVETTKQGLSFLGFDIWSSHSQKVVKDDFKSTEGYQQYVQAQHDATQLAIRMEAAKNQLKNAMINGGFSQCGMEQEAMEKAASSLATALGALTQMKGALDKRKSQATNQIKESQIHLVENQFKFQRIEDAFGFLQIMMKHDIIRRSVWLESNRQCFALQYCQKKESDFMIAITNGISEGGKALEGVQKKLEMLLPTIADNNQIDNEFEKLLLSNEKMKIEYTV